MLVGIDEVGRGCVAGPLCMSAVSLSSDISGLKDSKKLTPRQREKFNLAIRQNNDYLKIVSISNEHIDKYGLSWALRECAKQLVEGLPKSAQIIIDGNIDFIRELKLNSKAVIKADDKYPCVSAASIVAKVYRDKYMVDQSDQYPQYHFDKNKGYLSSEHLEAIKVHGLTKLHRKSFKIKL